jgi:site-specific DNA recombinase
MPSAVEQQAPAPQLVGRAQDLGGAPGDRTIDAHKFAEQACNSERRLRAVEQLVKAGRHLVLHQVQSTKQLAFACGELQQKSLISGRAIIAQVTCRARVCAVLQAGITMRRPPESAPRVAIYSRFSDEMQSPRSGEDQEREARRTAEREGWEVTHAEADLAVRAGAVAGRAGYARLMAAARRREFDVLLVDEISRFSRDFLGGMAELAALKDLGVQLADTKHGLIDMDSPVGQLSMAFGLASSQEETKRLGERSKRGLKGKVLRHYSSGGQPAYGYKRAPEYSATELDVDGRPKRVGVRFVPDPVEAVIIARIFGRYAEGNSKNAIARSLNEDGIPSRGAGRSRAGIPNSGTWSASSIKAILENELYSGTRFWNKHPRKGAKLPRTGKKQLRPNDTAEWITVEGYAPAPIAPELWERTRLRLQQDAQAYGAKHACHTGRRKHLLTGFVRCASCGANYVIGVHRRGMPHYRCSFAAARGRVVCLSRTSIPAPRLEERVRYVVDTVAKDPKSLAELVAEHNRRISSANEAQLGVVRALEARRDAAVRERGRFVEAIALGSGSSRALVAEVEKRELEIAALDRRIAEVSAQLEPLLLPQPAAVADYVAGSASVFEGDLARDRQLLEAVLDGIYVYNDGAIVLRFKDRSLFEPVRRYHIADLEAEPPALPAARRDQAQGLSGAQSVVTTDVRAGARAEEWEYAVREDRSGLAPVTARKGASRAESSTRNNVGVPSPTRPFDLHDLAWLHGSWIRLDFVAGCHVDP